jgi:hypothetical protein
MEAICSSETSVETQRTTRRRIPEEGYSSKASSVLDNKISERVTNSFVWFEVHARDNINNNNIKN